MFIAYNDGSIFRFAAELGHPVSNSQQINVARSIHILGSLVEAMPSLFIKLGQLESSWLRDQLSQIVIKKPVFICGLARSGTTILLEFLSGTKGVATHRYRDFPFVFVPVWWNWFLGLQPKVPLEAIERAHKDGILVTRESPEAMEEPIWMRFFPDAHESRVSNLVLASGDAAEFEAFYRDHIKKILLLRFGKRYISKGNYNLARVSYLKRLFPDAKFLVPIRSPLSHIASLIKQHKLFVNEETRDRRILDYMRRLGHFEFGLDRRPINMGNFSIIEEILDNWDKGQEVAGWAKYWRSIHDFVLNQVDNNPALGKATLIVPYDQLCADPKYVLEMIYAHCDLDIDSRVLSEQANRLKQPNYYKPSFSDDETRIIEEETWKTWDRVRHKAEWRV